MNPLLFVVWIVALLATWRFFSGWITEQTRPAAPAGGGAQPPAPTWGVWLGRIVGVIPAWILAGMVTSLAAGLLVCGTSWGCMTSKVLNAGARNYVEAARGAQVASAYIKEAEVPNPFELEAAPAGLVPGLDSPEGKATRLEKYRATLKGHAPSTWAYYQVMGHTSVLSPDTLRLMPIKSGKDWTVYSLTNPADSGVDLDVCVIGQTAASKLKPGQHAYVTWADLPP